MTRRRIWRAATGIVAVGALATACAPGPRAAVRGSVPVLPAPVTPATVSAGTAAAPAGAAPDPQAAADIQAAEQSLSAIGADLSSVDQAATSGENDVPSN